MTATHTAAPPTLTPARKRLIRRAYANCSPSAIAEPVRYLWGMPSFSDVSRAQIIEWLRAMGYGDTQRSQPASPAVTQAPAEPAIVDAGTGEWYSVVGVAAGLGIGVERVRGWQRLGWLADGPLLSAAMLRAFVRAHPLEIVPRYLHENEWLWLVSVLAGSREGEASHTNRNY